MTPLTLAAARSLLPNEILTDTVVKGLQLHGNLYSRTWKLYFRTKSGRARRPGLGTFPTISIEMAREAARELLGRVIVGEDPMETRRADRGAAKVAELCDLYLEKWSKVRKSKTSYVQDVGMIDMYIRPELGARLVKDVTLDDVELLLHAVHGRDPRFVPKRVTSWANHKQAPFAANRVRTLLSKMFRLAEERFEMRAKGTNPTHGAFRWKERPRKVYATPEQLAAIFFACDHLRPSYPLHVAAITALFFTGARVNEIAMAKKSQRFGDRIVLTEHKTMQKSNDDRVVHLPVIVTDILDSLPPSDSEYIFGGHDLREVWVKLRKRAGIEGLQLRDARRTFASVGLSSGKTLEQVGELLGHRSVQTTKGYAYLMNDPALRAANEIATQMRELIQLPPQAVALLAGPVEDPLAE